LHAKFYDHAQNAHGLPSESIFECFTRPSVWCFKILVMMQKLIMTAGVIFIFQGTMIQVAAAFVITFEFLPFVLWYRPLVIIIIVLTLPTDSPNRGCWRPAAPWPRKPRPHPPSL